LKLQFRKTVPSILPKDIVLALIYISIFGGKDISKVKPSKKEYHMAHQNFDLIVIGTGTAGLTVANKCRSKGLSVAIIDNKPFGGTCALRGCDPKKILVGFAETLDQVHRFQGRGLNGEMAIKWEDMIAFKNEFTNPIPEKREHSLNKNEIKTFHGTATFTGKNEIKVNEYNLHGNYILIGTGNSAIKLPFEGSEYLIDNEAFLNLKELPKRIAFVGGGYISMEFAHIAVRAGAEVTVINDRPRVLDKFDPFLVDILEKRSTELGIKLFNNSTVSKIRKDNNEFVLEYEAKEGRKHFSADLVIHGAGRSPNIEELNLAVANVAHDKKGIEINAFMQSTSNPSVYAAGDVAKGGLPLTPVASFEAHIVAANILRGNDKKAVYPSIPSVAFTTPHLASVGLTEMDAQTKGIKYKVNKGQTGDWFSAKRLNEKYEGYKVLLSEDGHKVLGAHLLGHGAADTINIFAMVIDKELDTTEIKKMIFAYPTYASDISHML
jgi:glutathione reductase (NADPH)